ncbi:MAG: DUF748 domain-containing protein, partial [Candidatus Omnitrophica bacterium]|nr:DUF748 domain-containing protein [Candidatus Omnitrophota bacterium]
MKKRFLLIPLVLLLVIILGFYYFQTIFFPVHLKQFILKKSAEFLGREVVAQEVKYVPLKGLVFKQLTIYDKYEKGQEKVPIVQVEEASLQIVIPALVKNQKIIIPSISIRNPYVLLVRTPDQRWNFSDLLEKKNHGKASKSPPLFLGNITVEDGRILLLDRSPQNPTMEIFDQLNLSLDFSLKKGIQFEAQTTLASSTSTTFPPPQKLIVQPPVGSLQLKGTYQPLTKQLSSEVTIGRCDLLRYLKFLPPFTETTFTQTWIEQAELRLDATASQFSINAKGRIQADMMFKENFHLKGDFFPSKLQFQRDGENFSFTTSFTASKVDFSSLQNIKFQGDLVGHTIQGTLSPNEKIFHFEGDLDVNQGNFFWTPDQNVQGNLQARALVVDVKPELLKIQGDLLLQNASSRLGNQRYLSGTFSLREASFQKELERYFGKGRLEGENVNLSLGTPFSATGNVKTDGVEFSYQPQQWSLKTSGKILGSDIKIQKDHQIEGDISVNDAQVSMIKGTLNVQGTAVGEELMITSVKNQKFFGNPAVQLNLHYPLSDPLQMTYQGKIDVASAAIKGLPHVEMIQNLEGSLTFQQDLIKTSSMKFTALDTPIQLSGTLSNFRNPILDIKLATQKILLTQLEPLLSPYLKRFQLTTPQGQANFQFQYQGPLSDPAQADIQGTAQLFEITLEGEKLPSPILGISGVVRYAPNALYWQNLHGTFQGRTYTLDGNVTNFSRPILETRVIGNELEFSTQIKILHQVLSVMFLKGTYHKTNFHILGDIRLKETLQDAILDMKGDFDIDLAYLKDLLPSWTTQINSLQPRGRITLNTLYQG